MSQLLTLEGRRSNQSSVKRFNKSNVNPKRRRGLKMIAKPLTCAAMSGTLELYGLTSIVRKVGNVAKKTTKVATKVVTKNPLSKAVSKSVVGRVISRTPVGTALSAAIRLPTTTVSNVAKAAVLASKGKYASALKTPGKTFLPTKVIRRATTAAKKTVVGRNIVKAATFVDKKVTKKVDANAKKVIVKAVTAAYGPAAGAAAQKYVPEGYTPAKAAAVVDQIVASPVAQEPTTSSVAQAQQIVNEQPVEQPAEKKSSALPIIAGLGALLYAFM